MGQKAARKAYPPLGNWLEQILLNVTISRLTRMVKGRQITDPILIVNGIVDHWRPRGYIKANRGIQQRDLLSPFLFVIAMDYLSSLIEDAQSRGIIQGYKSRDVDGRDPKGSISQLVLLY